jgi:SAM-dependent methyltransferase
VDSQTLRYYESYADKAARRYEGAEAGIASLFPFAFQRGERVLEIGAGSGRDAARLLQQGVEVQAVEPSSRLRRLALAVHPELRGRLFDGFLPGGLPPECQREYGGILLSAVIMHIPDGELFDAAFELRARLSKGGKLLISMPIERDDIRPGEQRDDSGRLMVIRSVAQVRLLFERLGFELENDWKSADSLGRGFLWASLFFRSSGATTRAIDRVESIINADRKVATYKLALVRALCDIAMTSWAAARWEPGGAVSVPLGAVSEKWQQYYWPLLEGDQVIPQINAESEGGKPIAFRQKLGELIKECRRAGGLSAFSRMQAEGTLPAAAARLSREAIRIIGSTIVKGPVKYAGGARGETEFSFDREGGRIRVQADVWRELSLMGHWIRDAVILRWAEMTARLSKGAVAPGAVIDKLLQSAEPWRADPTVRGLYEGVQKEEVGGLRKGGGGEGLRGGGSGGLVCVWTLRQLRSDFDVDHAIPFVFWQGSPSWNLFPADKRVNNAKRDKLPTSDLVRRREEAIVSCWRILAARMPVKFRRDAASLLGGDPGGGPRRGSGGDPGSNWEKPLFTGFLEAIEYTASVRGAERWEPG